MITMESEIDILKDEFGHMKVAFILIGLSEQ